MTAETEGPLPPPVVVYRGHDLVAVSKPSGEPVVAARGEPAEACLHRRLERHLGHRLWVIHRIDRDASGLVVFAQTAAAHRAASLAFEHREVRKTYLAFVAAGPEPESGRIGVALHAARKGKSRPARPGEPGSQQALTEYRVREGWQIDGASVSLLEAHPLTGRHHQIRVHLRSIGAPVLFDRLYGKGLMPSFLEKAPCRRLALHSLRLELPGGERRTVIEAPLAGDLEELRRWLDSTVPKPGRS